MKTYRSKVDKWLPFLLLPFLTVLTVLLVLMKAWPAALIVLLVLIFIGQLYLNTYYVLSAGTLQITCGWLYKKTIPLHTVRKIMRTKSALASPALSIDKLLIFFDRQQVMISPEDQEDFLLEIKRLNPSINI